MRRYSGFLLLELMAAITLVAGLLLVVGQWWQHQQRLEQRQQWLQHTEYLLQRAEQFWLQQGRPPTAINELLAPQELNQLALPWQQPWQLVAADSVLNWRITAPSQQQASWFSSQFQAASQSGQQVSIQQWGPLSSAPQDQYLHRVARPEQPELNSMQTHLHMQGHNVLGIGTLSAAKAGFQQLSSDSVLVNSARIIELQTDLLTATSVQTPYGDLQILLERIEDFDALWQECRAGGGCQ